MTFSFYKIAVFPFLGLLAFAASAQMQPPPRHDSRSPTGVSYHNGSFSFEETDLLIGDGPSDGLTLVRSYNSSSDGYAYPFIAPGWTSSLNIYVITTDIAQYPVPEGVETPPVGIETPPRNALIPCIANIVGGARSTGFYPPGGIYPCTYLQPGTYAPAAPSGDQLVYLGAFPTGHLRYTGADGSLIEFHPGNYPQAQYWLKADGTRLDFTYANSTGGTLKAVFSNRGWAILIESPTKACAVNLTRTYVTPTSACPSDAQTVTYTYAPGTYATSGSVLTAMTKGGATRVYRYASNDHVSCIVDPGQSTCRIENFYSACLHEPTLPMPQPRTRLNDPVISQVDGSGKSYTYTYEPQNRCPQQSTDPNPDYRPFSGTSITATETGVGGTVTYEAQTFPNAQLSSLRDPLKRLSSFTYQEATFSPCCQAETGEMTRAVQPEGNSVEWVRDARGNATAQIIHSKLGSGLSDIQIKASYPAVCTNVFTCNKSEWIEDARSGRTDFEYDPGHGGVTIEKSPATAGGMRVVKRTSYVRRTAWIKNSGGGYSASPYPVWLPGELRICRTTATVGNTCVGGTTDEVVTSYDYGPNSGPNNLLLRGQIVTADGVSLRTCYGYDADGRKISETSPRAGLTVCS